MQHGSKLPTHKQKRGKRIQKGQNNVRARNIESVILLAMKQGLYEPTVVVYKDRVSATEGGSQNIASFYST